MEERRKEVAEYDGRCGGEAAEDSHEMESEGFECLITESVRMDYGEPEGKVCGTCVMNY